MLKFYEQRSVRLLKIQKGLTGHLDDGHALRHLAEHQNLKKIR